MPNNSKLAVFAEKFIQAGWLLALIVAPLYFNIYSSRVFEPDKVSLLRTLALAMGAAWLILRAERRRAQLTPRGIGINPGARLRGWARATMARNPLALPALFLWLAYALSTLLSLSPTVTTPRVVHLFRLSRHFPARRQSGAIARRYRTRHQRRPRR
ncbi:MAG: hypothetical protein DCC52_14980 [Chloroflexi bacterium]|nr:MAG: hypothetical protein DCC52_14980 [Chloroflexota bacterium]